MLHHALWPGTINTPKNNPNKHCANTHYKHAPFPNSCLRPMELKTGFFYDMVKACAQSEQRLWILVLVLKIPLEFVSIYPNSHLETQHRP